jgi:FkbM family methyltransferase
MLAANNDAFLHMLKGIRGPTRVVDVGARWGVAEAWAPYRNAVEVFAFDPDAEECARLGLTAPSNVRYVPFALGSKRSRAPLYVTHQPACSSLFPPRQELARAVPVLADIELDTVVEIQLVDLDSWRAENSVGPIHYMKLDVQGAELEVLRGAAFTLADVLILDLEVEWNPIYEGQALFGDIDGFLRQNGFVLWRLSNHVHYSNARSCAASEPLLTTDYFDSNPVQRSGMGGQLFWSHAHYCRSEFSSESDAELPIERAAQAASLAVATGLVDLARTIVDKGPVEWKESFSWGAG